MRGFFERKPHDLLSELAERAGKRLALAGFQPRRNRLRGDGKLLVNEDALDRLQALRNALGKPMIINSAYRSPEHNRRVGGAKASQHLEG